MFSGQKGSHDFKIDDGNIDIRIRNTGKPGKPGSIEFNPDYPSKTKNPLTTKGVKVQGPTLVSVRKGRRYITNGNLISRQPVKGARVRRI
jgi:hypothetical protein